MRMDRGDPRLEEGRALFNAGRFFEAHEKWEEVWLAETGPAKRLLQGLIQIAAGFLKAESGSFGVAARLLEAGVAKLESAGAPERLAVFAAEVRRLTEMPHGLLAERASRPLVPPLDGVK